MLYYSLTMLDGESGIIERATKGEAEAFGLLYDHYLPKIYRFVFLKVGRREEAEDLTHQVFLNSWQHIANYQSMGHPFSTLLYRMARNEVIDYIRTKKNPIPLDELAHDPSVDQEVDRHFDIGLQIHDVQNAMHTLTPEQQDVVIMRFVDELTNKEISEVLQKSEGTIRIIQHRAIKKLKSILDA